ATADESLRREMARLRRLVETAHAARNEAGIKVRQPLQAVTIAEPPLPPDFEAILLEELNVKTARYAGEGGAVSLDTTISLELKGKFQSYTWLAVIAWVVVIADRVTKIVVEHRYGVGYGPKPIVDSVLFLTVLRNSGAAFGLFKNFTAGFLVISLLVMAAILVYYPRIPAHDWPARIGLAMVFGGAGSNAYDRGVQGSVIDLIQVTD